MRKRKGTLMALGVSLALQLREKGFAAAFPSAILLVALLAPGCALTQYGTLRMPEKTDPVTIQFLQKNWEDYEIYYTGIHAGRPSGILFDRKDDDRGFVTERWFRVESKEILDDLIESIAGQRSMAAYSPRLWRVVGPEGHLYGHMFTPWNHAVMRAIDEKTLFVHDLSLPPYPRFRGNGGYGM
jgi:hypothetical protein